MSTALLSGWGSRVRPLAITAFVIVLALASLGWYWSYEPAQFDPVERATERTTAAGAKLVPGSVLVSTANEVARTLLDKPGGYLSNDMFPPVSPWLMDNMPNWEWGALVQVRDVVKAMRNDFSRSQSQSKSDPDLEIADPQFNFPNNYWILPATEDEYRKGITALDRYLLRLGDENEVDAQFYTRADNLQKWLEIVGQRLGDLAQRLSASVGERRHNTALAGEPGSTQSTATPDERDVRTPWLQIDDVFYESRGAAWAVLHLLKAAQHDFASVLKTRNAEASLRQVIRELEGTQAAMWSPVILNGSGFGLFANHSLVMASYISRANASLIDLRKQLEKG